MYSSTIESIAFGEKYSEAIEKTIGLKQGDPLSATLLIIYIKDFPLILEKTTQPFENLHLQITPVISLLFVDDLIITAPTETENQISCKNFEKLL